MCNIRMWYCFWTWVLCKKRKPMTNEATESEEMMEERYSIGLRPQKFKTDTFLNTCFLNITCYTMFYTWCLTLFVWTLNWRYVLVYTFSAYFCFKAAYWHYCLQRQFEYCRKGYENIHLNGQILDIWGEVKCGYLQIFLASIWCYWGIAVSNTNYMIEFIYRPKVYQTFLFMDRDLFAKQCESYGGFEKVRAMDWAPMKMKAPCEYTNLYNQQEIIYKLNTVCLILYGLAWLYIEFISTYADYDHDTFPEWPDKKEYLPYMQKEKERMDEKDRINKESRAKMLAKEAEEAEKEAEEKAKKKAELVAEREARNQINS